jgi:hypothetical protein
MVVTVAKYQSVWFIIQPSMPPEATTGVLTSGRSYAWVMASIERTTNNYKLLFIFVILKIINPILLY